MAMKLTNHPLFPRLCLDGMGQGDASSSPGEGTPAPESGEAGNLEGQEGKTDITDLSQEELDQLIAQEEEESITKELGAGKFKTFKALMKGYKDLESQGSAVFNRVNKLAAHLKIKPEALLEHLEKQSGAGGKPDGKPAAEPTGKEDDKTLTEIKSMMGRSRLDNMFYRFQNQMEKGGVDIPEELQPKLDKRIPILAADKSEEELVSYNPYPDAYEYYLFKLQKGGEKSLEEVEEDLAAIKAIREKKKRTLKIPSTSSRQAVPVNKKEAADWGAVDKL